MNNEQLKQSAKDEAAREYGYKSLEGILYELSLGLAHSGNVDRIINRAMEIYAEKVGGYWEQRCKLAEICLEESPCDTDITSDQINAWHNYNNFIKTTNP